MFLSRLVLRPEIKGAQLANLITGGGTYGIHQLMWGLFPERHEQKRHFLYRDETLGNQGKGSISSRNFPVYYLLSESKPNENSPIFNVEVKSFAPQLDIGDKLAFNIRVNPVYTEARERKGQEAKDFLAKRVSRPVRDKNKLTRKMVRHDLVMHSQQQWLKQQLKTLDVDLLTNTSKGKLKEALLDYAGDVQVDEWQSIIEQGPFFQILEDKKLGRKEKLEWALKTQVELAICTWWQKQGELYGFKPSLDHQATLILQTSSYAKHTMPEKHKRASFQSIDLCGEIEVTDPAKFKQALFKGIGRAKAFGCGLMLIRRI